jgi:hypothetical protein
MMQLSDLNGIDNGPFVPKQVAVWSAYHYTINIVVFDSGFY